jgi:DNA-binding transcriptional MerR regulator
MSLPQLKVSPEESELFQAETVADTKAAEKAPGAYRTISEVAEELDVPQHVLRFWETKFTQLKPLKRGGGRRYYRPEDTSLLRQIHTLLYSQGYTIKGAQKVLKDDRARTEPEEDNATPVSPGLVERAMIAEMLAELKALRALV